MIMFNKHYILYLWYVSLTYMKKLCNLNSPFDSYMTILLEIKVWNVEFKSLT